MSFTKTEIDAYIDKWEIPEGWLFESWNALVFIPRPKYKMNIRWGEKWEPVASGLSRIEVPGGWLYAVVRKKEEVLEYPLALSFVPRHKRFSKAVAWDERVP